MAFAFPAEDSTEIKKILDNLKKEYHDARHQCYAYMLGPGRDQWRVNDDGEPSGTAGKQILGQINSNELTNILIVVVRYFGGTLLGTGGLINAYRKAAADAIGNSGIVLKKERIKLRIRFLYEALNDVMKIMKDRDIIQEHQQFDNECTMDISVPRSMEEAVTGQLLKIKGLTTEVL